LVRVSAHSLANNSWNGALPQFTDARTARSMSDELWLS